MHTTISAALQQTALAEQVVELQYQLQPGIWKPYGDPGRQKSVRDVGYHLQYLSEAVEANDPNLFVEYLVWVKSLFDHLDFPESVLPNTLYCLRQVLALRLEAEARQLALEILDQGAQSLAAPYAPQQSYLTEDNLLARQFLDLLLLGQRQKASQLILEAVQAGMPVREVYLQVFQNTQREIGLLWQTNRISVAQEHFCTAATQLVMSQLYPYIFTGERKRRRLVMACVGGELHELGARMVADFFEMEDWNTYYLGANTPMESVLRTVSEQKADLLAISVTMTFHISKARELIRQARAGASPELPILVGGYPFNLSPRLWEQVGADAYAPDAQGAMRAADQLAR